VDGIITDDSDVFLFGGTHVYRNVMSDKEGEHFALDMITDEFDLSREKFILLGMLLGCDYCDGVDGVGAKTAMRIIKCATNQSINQSFIHSFIHSFSSRVSSKQLQNV
jgi:DNA excision repair protein ERCC-5